MAEKRICTVDPVCNMDLGGQPTQHMYDFEDVTYYFCSHLCQEEFAKQPEKYAKKE